MSISTPKTAVFSIFLDFLKKWEKMTDLGAVQIENKDFQFGNRVVQVETYCFRSSIKIFNLEILLFKLKQYGIDDEGVFFFWSIKTFFYTI